MRHRSEPSLPRPRIRSLLRSLALAAFALASPACEPRIEEPVPPARSEPRRGDNGAATAQNDPSGRCIDRTPETPKRATPPAGPDPRCPADPEGPGKLRMGKVAFKEAGGRQIDVEIAETEHTRERGLMYRKEMTDSQGMIFLFKERRVHSFWMHNTCIPLDMLFIDDDGMIVGIEENAPTMNDSTFEVDCASRYVLEVNAGWTRKNGVKAGQRVEIQGI